MKISALREFHHHEQWILIPLTSRRLTFASFNESMSGRFFGIGAQLKEDDGKIKIASLISGGPAWKSGELKENDEIIKVGQGKAEPVDVTGYAVTDAVKLIRGAEKGSEVKLTIKTHGWNDKSGNYY